MPMCMSCRLITAHANPPILFLPILLFSPQHMRHNLLCYEKNNYKHTSVVAAHIIAPPLHLWSQQCAIAIYGHSEDLYYFICIPTDNKPLQGLFVSPTSESLVHELCFLTLHMIL